ncbi:MAG TPA: methyltransferase [Actinomycetota bacterium]|nr:methyltransferase [Actinomycetota bacterium]
MSEDQRVAANRSLWDRWTAAGHTPAFAKLRAFESGTNTLHPVEIEEVGDVSGKSLLHLQCHFGIDTMSWARLGARVLGLDFSGEAIALATELADKHGLDARFVASDVYDAAETTGPDAFDIVVTTLGVLAWLPDLDRWAQVVRACLKPGGVFYLLEYHPITFTFDDAAGIAEPRLRYPYFPREEPIVLPVGGDKQYGWPFSMGSVISAIAGAGLDIEFVHEFPYSESQHVPFLEKRGERQWMLPSDLEGELPLMFSVRAVNPQT